MTPRKARAYLYTRWEFYLLGRSVSTVPTYDVQYVRRLHLKALFLTLHRCSRKSLTPPGWVVYGKRRHAELPEEDRVPPQLYPW